MLTPSSLPTETKLRLVRLRELSGYTGDKSDSAALDASQHIKVIVKLKENGGRLPSELR